MKGLKTFNQWTRKVLLVLGSLLLSVFVVTVLLQVVSRNVLRMSMDWTSEVAVFSFVWSVFLGAAIAVSTRRHYVVDLVPARYAKVNKGLIILAELLVMIAILALIGGGTKFALLGWRRLTTALEIPRFWLFVSLPISASFMFLFNLENLLCDLRDFRIPQEGGGEER